MFRFFDKNFNNSVSFQEFQFGCEELDMRLPPKDIQLLYNYIDKSGDGEIGYKEFMGLCDERRLGQDPFENKVKYE